MVGAIIMRRVCRCARDVEQLLIRKRIARQITDRVRHCSEQISKFDFLLSSSSYKKSRVIKPSRI